MAPLRTHGLRLVGHGRAFPAPALPDRPEDGPFGVHATRALTASGKPLASGDVLEAATEFGTYDKKYAEEQSRRSISRRPDPFHMTTATGWLGASPFASEVAREVAHYSALDRQQGGIIASPLVPWRGNGADYRTVD